MRLWGQYSMNSLEKTPRVKEYEEKKADVQFEKIERASDEKSRNDEITTDNIDTIKEQAKTEAIEAANSIADVVNNNEKDINISKSERSAIISKKQKEESFDRTMKRVRQELPTAQRVFSKFIHNKTIEKTSETIGNTIARPNSMLSGSFFAFILTLMAYSIAKTMGYRLSGFETIISFIIGWILGLVFDYFRSLLNGHK